MPTGPAQWIIAAILYAYIVAAFTMLGYAIHDIWKNRDTNSRADDAKRYADWYVSTHNKPRA